MCARCLHLQLSCKIENSFKRVGKRSRIAELEKEIADLRAGLARRVDSCLQVSSSATQDPAGAFAGPNGVLIQQCNGPQDAVAGLLDLRNGHERSTARVRDVHAKGLIVKRLEDVVVHDQRITELFELSVLQFVYKMPFLLLTTDESGSSICTIPSCPFWTHSRHRKTTFQHLPCCSGPFSA